VSRRLSPERLFLRRLVRAMGRRVRLETVTNLFNPFHTYGNDAVIERVLDRGANIDLLRVVLVGEHLDVIVRTLGPDGPVSLRYVTLSLSDPGVVTRLGELVDEASRSLV